ncbi:MAG TPA: hypothetical protein VMJ65_16700 [Solirubrobacteraceae bacterium]|nr:hypothetical protein [Solirubrobacteraceae bacterium]
MPVFRFRPRRRPRLRSRDLTPDLYLTDGRRLFRVVSRFVNDGSILVVIEDCVTLDARAYAAAELVPMDVRPVRRLKPPRAGETAPPSTAEEKPLQADTPAVA